MRSLTSYDFRSISSNAAVMLAWYLRRALHWPRVVLFVPVYCLLLLFFALFVALDDLMWEALLPARYRSLRRRYSPVPKKRAKR